MQGAKLDIAPNDRYRTWRTCSAVFSTLRTMLVNGLTGFNFIIAEEPFSIGIWEWKLTIIGFLVMAMA